MLIMDKACINLIGTHEKCFEMKNSNFFVAHAMIIQSTYRHYQRNDFSFVVTSLFLLLKVDRVLFHVLHHNVSINSMKYM
jgi:hypothetical protein